MSWTVHNRDCIEHLLVMPDQSVDALVTDPPAGISFMGKAWDSDLGGRAEWVAWMSAVMRECWRVLKPGAHGLVWALPRTSHWTATALEDAGFEIRDVVTHLFGQGFPKSLDVSKAIDKAAGAEREVVGHGRQYENEGGAKDRRWEGGTTNRNVTLTAPSTESAKQWHGWGTALKPAAEFWILVRKPCSEKTVAANVQKWGTGALNIDGCRIDTAGRPGRGNRVHASESILGANSGMNIGETAQGRFPANLVLSHSPYCTDEQCDIECAAYGLDLQSGFSKTPKSVTRNARINTGKYGDFGAVTTSCAGDSGGASRFFYCAKISSSERNAGLEDEPERKMARGNGAQANLKRGEHVDRAEVGSGFDSTSVVKNHHPTVKPIKLMSYLTRLITPPGGTVLDPFAGSGSTGIACKREGFRFIGIEKEKEYVEIAKKRIESANVGL